MKTAERLLTPKEAAKIAGVEASKFSKWIGRKKVRVERFLVGQEYRSRVLPGEAERIKGLLARNLPLPVVGGVGD